MAIQFSGRWHARVIGKNAGFSQRIVVTGAAVGSGTYAGQVGIEFDVDGDNWQAELQWNNNAGSGWQPSDVLTSEGMSSPLVTIKILRADDNVPGSRDGDFDDLEVLFEHMDAPFDVVQRPFALDRGTLTMLPDGIFDASQGVQYMGVRIVNTWFWDWSAAFPATGMKIGIAPASRANLAAQGIHVIDTWTPQEQEALGQTMDGGFVRVDELRKGQETLVYVKIDVSASNPGKPEIGFVAQRDAWDAHYDAPSRVVDKQIYVSRSSYDPSTKEVVVQIPEGTLRLRLQKAIIDRKAASEAVRAVRGCLKRNPGSKGSEGDVRRRRTSDELRDLLRALLAGEQVDPCKIRALLELCCDDGSGRDGDGGRRDGEDRFPGGGLGDGSGADDWCRFRPIAWLPVDFEYRIEPNPPYSGPLGPLAFEDPWWKVVLIILAVLLAIGSLIADYVQAAQDPRFIIGSVVDKGDVVANAMDCALADLNGSRGVDLGLLDAQSDDVNNGSPINALNSVVQLDRSDNGDFGIQDAVEGNVVWKSGGTSATTRGEVEDLDYATSIEYDDQEFISGVVSFTRQVLVGQIDTLPQPLSQGGDSVSVWVDLASGRPVALNFAGPEDESGGYGVGNPIRDVIQELDIRFNT